MKLRALWMAMLVAVFAIGAQAADISGVPASHDFGDQIMNGCYSESWTIENTSGSDTWEIVSISSTLPFILTISDHILDPGETATLTIRFQPPVDLPGPNSYSDVVEFETDESETYSISVEGVGETVETTWTVDYGISMISLPYKPAYPSFQDIFGDDLNGVAASWTVAGYDFPPSGWFWAHDDSSYVDGMGYFLAISDPLHEYTLDYVGYHYGCENFEFDLDLDWNLIGVPNSAAYDLEDCLFTWGGDDFNYADAVDQMVIFPDTYFIDAELGGYVGYGGYFVDIDQEPLRGYWIRTAREGVTMTVPNLFAGNPPIPPAPPVIDDASDDWTARILVTDGIGWYAAPVVGVDSDATDGYDFAHDASEGPENPNGALPVTAYFEHAAWGQDDTMFLKDIRSSLEVGESHTWTLSISSDSEREIELAWPYLNLPDGIQVVMENTANGETFDLSVLSTYTFDADAGITEFEITANGIESSVGEAPVAGLPTEYAIERAYPNPFNPSTTVSIALPQTAEVTVAVHDITGRLVAELAQGSFSAGRHDITWNAAGQASGVYFVRMSGNGVQDVAKVVLMK